jgi:Gas vesicle synthesis protein GvpL/GvpF
VIWWAAARRRRSGSPHAGAAAERIDMSSAPSEAESSAGAGQQAGWYVYGILPGDVELTEEIRGIGDREVTLVRDGELAALVSEVDLLGPLGTTEDLQAHKEILDSVAVGAPVLPLRFGAVVTSQDAVVSELLEPNRDEFAAALGELEGRTEYVVKGQYAESAILEEILSQDSEAADLREQISGRDADATREERIRLGEIISSAVAAKRDQDTQQLVSALGDLAVASLVRDPADELEAVNVAFLVEEDQADDLELRIDDLSAGWDGRVELRVLGPMAPYDFVGSAREDRG